ncbi:DUF1801 domain-containing protein [Paraferrimonas sp. SM1919]|uniref:DUF1801 domain-containing protein n=1 Tax=Paraferrimonas sp. SM1919 TaxID=2662263 RepID=UPI0013D62C26|nr:DUF1801 domain-containing protein [Paraferrimonas sp. SM1919]
MSKLKTRPNQLSVDGYIASISPESKRQDAAQLLALFTKVTGAQAVMWGNSMVGFGSYQYTNTMGTNEWLMTGFSARKQNLTLYIMQGFVPFEELLSNLGKYKHAKSCLYINKLADVDLTVLQSLIEAAVADMQQRYPCKI